MVSVFNRSKLKICGLNKKIVIYENDFELRFFSYLDWWWIYIFLCAIITKEIPFSIDTTNTIFKNLENE
jgi:hypothetical protein